MFFSDKVSFIDYLKGFVIYIDEPLKCIQKAENLVYENFEELKIDWRPIFIDIEDIVVKTFLSIE